jgi:formyltetrahydrofolate-dependent phosphoribosylglycinamide formyltransferase
LALKKLKTAIFISGKGSNLKNLFKFSLTKKSPIIISFVVTNNKDAKGIIFSKKNNIESKIYKYFNKSNAEKKILKDLNKKKIDLICLAGFMKILSKSFINKFKGKIVNIHPSLLPKYKGLNTHKRAIENKDKFSGCTVHLVNSRLDSGKIILQKKVKINKNDNHMTLKRKVLKQEHLIYPRAIKKLLSNP